MSGIKKYRERGVCISCGQPREPGRVRCRPCLDKHAIAVQVCIDRSKANGLCIRCHHRPQASDRVYCRECIISTKARRTEVRMKVLVAYSGDPPFCCCCGERHYEFLALDHIHNNGAQERKSKKGRPQYSNMAIMARLVRQNFPPGYQVLCHNCNCAKGWFGSCPHERERINNSS